jgi:hypothetical protein
MPWLVVTPVFLDFRLMTFSNVEDKDPNSSSMVGCSIGKSRTTLGNSECPLIGGLAIRNHDL